MILSFRRIVVVLMMIVFASCAHKEIDEKIYVVQRERESLQVFDEVGERTVQDLGNLNHATMKFKWGMGYVLARDGFISQIDIKGDRLIKKAKIGKSGIGLTFTANNIVIVNYDPASVVILSKDLEILKTISTDSRNVGVKSFEHYLVFSLMDKNEIWVLDTDRDFSLIKRIENVGELPFDALINNGKYLVGFFKESTIGFLDLNDFQYQRIELSRENEGVVYKVPHLGYWGIVGDYAFIPIATQKKILVIDLIKKTPLKEISLPGEPVFASVSPDKKKLVVNYSGGMENFVSVIDTGKKELINTFEAGKRVMHLRFSTSGKQLFISSYFENKMHIFDVANWTKSSSLNVATPSGIFLKNFME